jgi:hypothetical protein
MLLFRNLSRFVVAFATIGTVAGCSATVVTSRDDAGTDSVPIDVPSPTDAPVQRTCITTADCRSGEECLVREGCDTPSYCGPALRRPCTDDIATYCGCDGVSFVGSSTCPPRSYAYRGPCRGVDPPPPGCRLSDGRICLVGQACVAPDGCNTCVCNPDRTLNCTLRGCVDAGSPMDVPLPRSCRTGSDCPPSMMCDGPPGCGVPWSCVLQRGCTADFSPFCGCDGRTFNSSSTCVGRPYARTGPCESVDAGPTPLCRPQTASGVGLCELFLGFVWNGTDCIGLSGCSCVGSDCSSLVQDLSVCLAAHRSCPRPL